MRNLKRVLGLIMAIAMMMSLMVFSTSAAFSDQDKIENTDAVDKMVSLNIINGKENGNFDPTGIVTRAEMCKMIYVALSGGNDMKSNGPAVTSFTDTKGHWAEGYIEYCVNMGIVNGMGDNTFAPNQGVTPTQAAKMLLVALGYDAAYEEFVGAAWAINTNRIAQQKGLYDEIQDADPFAPMSRDNAAQMVNNFCDAPMVKYEFGISGGGSNVIGVKQAEDITPTQTVLSKYYKLVTSTAAVLTNITYDSAKNEYTYNGTYKSTVDYSNLYGQSVEVLWRNKDNSTAAGVASWTSGDSIYNIQPVDSKVVAEGVPSDFDTYDTAKKTLKFDGTTYDLDDTVTVYKDYANNKATFGVDANGDGTITGVTAPYNVRLISNKSNGDIDTIVVVPFTVSKVTYVGTSSTTFNNGVNSYDNDDFIAYNGIAKDDLVAFYLKANVAEGKAEAVKLDVVTGTISGTKTDSGVQKYLINDTWYTEATSNFVSLDSIGVGDKIDFIAVGSVLYYTKITSGANGVEDIAAVINAGTVAASGAAAAKEEAKLLLADGTKKVVTVVDDDGDPASAVALKGKMVTFEVNNDGEYILTAASDSNKAGYDDYDTTPTVGNPITTVGGYKVADDAVVFVYDSADNDGKLLTGKELTTLNNANYGTTAETLMSKEDGFQYAKVVVVNGDVDTLDTIAGDSYGYLLADSYKSKENGTNYRNFVIWTANGKVTAREESNSTTQLAEGTIVKFDQVSDNVVKNVNPVPTATISAITGWNDKDIAFESGVVSKVTADTVVLYVNTEDSVGETGGSISVAGEPIDGTYIENACYVKVSGHDYVDLLVVDVNNDYSGSNTVGVDNANVANAYLDGTDLYVALGTATGNDVASYLDTSAVKSVTVYDSSNAVKTTAFTATGDYVKIIYANDTTKILNLKQGYVVTPATEVTDAVIGTTVGKYTTSTTIHGNVVTAATMVKPTDVATVSITWASTAITGTKDTVTVTATGSSASAGVAKDFAAGAFSAVTKTVDITTFTADSTISYAGANS